MNAKTGMGSKLQKSVLKHASKLLEIKFNDSAVPESHGHGHALKVLANLQKALESNKET